MYSIDESEQKCLEDQYKELISKHWKKKDIVITDFWTDKIFPIKPPSVTFTVGCYTVRISSNSLIRAIGIIFPKINLLDYIHKVSAKHNSNSYGIFANGFKYLCLARIGFIYYGGVEKISHIITAKENGLSDNQASLFVKKRWIGSSFGCDYWYELRPDGTVTDFSIHDLSKVNDSNV